VSQGRQSFNPRPRLYFWQVIAARVPRESTIRTLVEISPWRQRRHGLVSEAEREPLSLRLPAAHEEERIGRTR